MRKRFAVIVVVASSASVVWASTVWAQPASDRETTPGPATAGDAGNDGLGQTDPDDTAGADGGSADSSARPLPSNLTPAQLVLMHDAEIAELNRQLQASNDQIQQLSRQLQDLKEEMRTVQEQFFAGDSSSARELLGAMSRDGTLRKNLGSVAQGKINIVNYTGRDALIFINGTRWRAIPNESYIYAPVGKVTFQQPHEADPVFYDEEAWEYKDGTLQLTYKLYLDDMRPISRSDDRGSGPPEVDAELGDVDADYGRSVLVTGE